MSQSVGSLKESESELVMHSRCCAAVRVVYEARQAENEESRHTLAVDGNLGTQQAPTSAVRHTRVRGQ
jgi:hypothetical protein